MGMYFTAQAAPGKEVPCLHKQYGDPCESWCNGTMWESEAPDMAMPYSKATPLINTAGIQWLDGSCAYLDPAEMPKVLGNLLKAINLEKSRAHLEVRDDEVVVGARGATIIRCGDSDERWLERLKDLQKLVLYCHERNLSISMA